MVVVVDGAAGFQPGLELLAAETTGEELRRGVEAAPLTRGCLMRGLTLLEHVAVADRAQEWLEVVEEVVLRDAGLPVEEEQQLALHEVDLREGEAEAVVALDGRVAGPVLVLGTGVVEILGGEDEGCEEDPVDGAAHALGDWGEPSAQAVQIDEGGHEGGHLDLRAGDERGDEEFDRG